MNLEEIQSAISELSRADLARFSRWFEEFLADRWDRPIEEDVRAGKLDALAKQARDNFEAGRC